MTSAALQPLDHASDAIRAAIHETQNEPLGIADTYTALGAVSELVYRLPQLLDQTVRGIKADSSVQSTSGAVDQDLAAISDQIAKATTALATAANYLAAAHNHASRLHT